jgi:hypothetical protein
MQNRTVKKTFWEKATYKYSDGVWHKLEGAQHEKENKGL